MNGQFIIENDILKKYSGIETKVVVPEGIREIATGAFTSSNIESVILPSTLKKIGENAFMYAKQLKKIEIPSSVTTISKGAFSYSGLEMIVLPKKLKNIGANTFSGTKLREIILPDGLKTIGDSAFKNCFQLKKVIFPASIEKIGNYAFSESAIKNTNLSQCHPQFGWNAFGLCEGLADQEGFVVIDGVLFESPAMYKKETIVIPNSVTQIPLSSLSCENEIRYRDGNNKIINSFGKKIVIPKTVNTLAEIKCPNAKEIEIHAQVNLGSLALSSCKKLEKLLLPKTCEISQNVFGFDEKSKSRFKKVKIQYLDD